MERLLELARTTIKQYRAEEVKREIFLDCDLFGRDVVTLICETDSVDLLEDNYIEKLADEAWDGPTRVDRSPFWLNTSYSALKAFSYSNESLKALSFLEPCKKHKIA